VAQNIDHHSAGVLGGSIFHMLIKVPEKLGHPKEHPTHQHGGHHQSDQKLHQRNARLAPTSLWDGSP
jgi:hypothetical protein